MIWTAAILLGLAGSVHCLGMCGPIVLAVPVGGGSAFAKALKFLVYHIGRISGYAVLGFLFGTLGYGLNLTGLQQGLSIGVGVLMLLMIWAPGLGLRGKSVKGFSGFHSWINGQMAKRLKQNRSAALLGLGFFNGFLPCGLVYIAITGAVASFDPVNGVLFMVLFGIGTMPALLALGLSGSFLTPLVKQKLSKLAPAIVTVFAIWFIVRGLGLDIPYLSPELGPKVSQTEVCEP